MQYDFSGQCFMTDFHLSTNIKTAVVTGRHPFDVPAFHAVFRAMPDVDFYPQHMEDFVSDAGSVRQKYDVVVFYNHHQQTPGAEEGWWEKRTLEALQQLGETPQGILVLHHGLVAFRDWPFWAELVGLHERSMNYKFGQELQVDVANAEHPITRDLSPWTMTDETYSLPSERPGSEVLLTTNHPDSTRVLAWTRQFRQSRVFCFQSGHDAATFHNENFRTVLHNGIRWLAHRI
jgi:type 1 glutamine amidotransferase